jgi:outer membrane protein assembly factor BamC
MKTIRLRPYLATVLILCALLAACSNSRKEDDAYKNSKAMPPLEVPPDLVNPPKDSSTALPELPPAGSPQKPPAPPAAAKTPPPVEGSAAAVAKDVQTAAIHVEKEGAQRWLVVPGSVDQVQQRVKDFLLQKGYSVAKESPGALETDWRGGEETNAGGDELDSALQAGLRNKFKLRIEAGRGVGTSEVRIEHYGLQRVMVDGKPQWQPRASDPLAAADLLDQLRDFLIKEGTVPEPVSDLPAVKARVSLDGQGIATLHLDEDFDRAWHRVGLALGRGRFIIDDRDRSAGIYNIRLGTAFKEDRKAGFLARLFGSNAGDPDEKYRLAVKGGDGETRVVVQFPGGGPVTTGIGQRILERLKEKME